MPWVDFYRLMGIRTSLIPSFRDDKIYVWDHTLVIDSDNNTVEACLDTCAGQGTAIRGVKDGKECR
jgi:hypothetical protein